MSKLFDLADKTALITGASRGIGRQIAGALARAGARVIVTAREAAALEPVLAEIRDAGGTAEALALDVRDIASSQNAIAGLGPLEILINNAGVEEVRPSLDVDEALWDKIVDTNLKGAFFVAQSVARLMQGTGGSIINLCSLTSHVGIPTAVPYGASKSGLLGMTRALAAEWAPLGIRVNAIAPGYFRTAMTDVFYENADWQTAMRAKIPQKRFGDLADLDGVAVFLASDASRYITGDCIAVDGGYLASI